MPIFGLASRVHATVKRMFGITSGTSDSAKKSDLNGVLVRSLIQASKAPGRKANMAVPEANFSELNKRASVSRFENAVP